MKPDRVIALFDSAPAMLRLLARHLDGGTTPMGVPPNLAAGARLVLPAVNRLPVSTRQTLYSAIGAAGAVRPEQVGKVDTAAIARWAAAQHPRRRYPAVLIGSSSGAVSHLAALAGVPWLPQTLLMPVRHGGVDPDDPQAAMHALAGARESFTAANPGVALHHMHDANQDRLMIQRMAYFRFKYRTLPDAYAAFLRDCLEPGGTVVVVDCEQRWPVTTTGERQVFQHGAVGGATAAEYEHGGPRVAHFLAGQGASRRAWAAPAADTTAPEAEWGFDRALLGDLDELCRQQGWLLARLRFSHPDSLSGATADIYRSWYGQHGAGTGRLLVGTFALMDVHAPLRLGMVPYWATFPTQHARDRLLEYLDGVPGFEEIRVGLFSHGVRSIGWASIGDWGEVLARAGARRRSGLCGVDEAAYPQDFACYVRYHDRLAEMSPPPQPVPHPAPWPWLEGRLAQLTGASYLTGTAAQHE